MKQENLTIVARSINAVDLKGIPFISIGDLVFTICIKDEEKRRVVTYDEIEKSGMTGDDVKKIALENDARNAVLESMEEALVRCMTGSDKVAKPFGMSIGTFSFARSKMWVLSNLSSRFGAGLLLNRELLSKMGDQVKDDFYIIPSSVHEVLIVPTVMDADELKHIIQDINANEVEPQDRLSDVPYYWDNERKLLSTAAHHFATIKEVERQA